jgi:hypothetical protein
MKDKMKKVMGRAIAHICANSNCSKTCAKILMVKQALRVIAKERRKSEAVRVLFYSKNPAFHPRWQYHALTTQITVLIGEEYAKNWK